MALSRDRSVCGHACVASAVTVPVVGVVPRLSDPSDFLSDYTTPEPPHGLVCLLDVLRLTFLFFSNRSHDEAPDLRELGNLQITRASHVEPDAEGYWFADMGPVGGPVLGPFRSRTEALGAEREWLAERMS